METKFSLTLSPEEVRSLLMTRIERSLRESGVTLTEEARERIAGCLPLPADALVVGGSLDAPDTAPERRHNYKPTIQEARAVLNAKDRAVAASGNRARLYSPTSKAKEVSNAQSTVDRVLNLIVRSNVCTLGDLEKTTKRPRRALYTALWRLKKDGLIDSRPIAAVTPGSPDRN